jgi:hypothetical protein
MPSTLTLNKQDTFQLQYQAADGVLCGRWLGPVLDADLRAHYTQLLQAAQHHGDCCYWLLDMRERNWHMPSFGQWVSTEFAAAVRAALAPPVFVAYILSPRHRSAAARAQEQRAQQHSQAQQLHSNIFDDEEAALAWLRQQLAATEVG